ncbi:MAG: glycosyltransferase family 2 protein [Chthoniobacterales bacterium]|nr:glycosyltransferase family 2 protein [Chthoniobacterales bacterium]
MDLHCSDNQQLTTDNSKNLSRHPLSIAIISYNEERTLARCLQSIADLAHEIVLVDSGSQDKTLSIAASFGARIIHQPWLGYAAQKNVAIDHCTQSWVLALDCDEEVSPELHQSLVRFFEEGRYKEVQGASFARKTWFLDRWITHGDWYPDKKLRLFRRDQARWINPIHEKIALEGPVVTLPGELLHYSFPSMKSYLDKIHPFSEAFLKEQRQKKKPWSLGATITHSLWRFFRAYILRCGFLDGFPGLWIAVATAFAVFVRYSRLYEEEKRATESTTE